MSYSDCLETKKLLIQNKGLACIKCPSTFDVKEVHMESDLRLTGTLNGNDPNNALCGCLRPSQLVVSGLVGFWEMWGIDNEQFKFASYNPVSGQRIAVPSTQIPAEGTNSDQHQFNPDKVEDAFVYFSNTTGGWAIGTFNTLTNRINYLSIANGSWQAICYDLIADRYLGWQKVNEELHAFDPTTGINTLLSSITPNGSSATDSVIINNTVYISFSGLNQINLTRFDRATGAALGNITWTGSYQFSGTQFINAIDLSILGMALDKINATLYFLLERAENRYLGSVSAASLPELETHVSSGTFNITLAKYVPTDKLEALSFK